MYTNSEMIINILKEKNFKLHDINKCNGAIYRALVENRLSKPLIDKLSEMCGEDLSSLINR